MRLIFTLLLSAVLVSAKLEDHECERGKVGESVLFSSPSGGPSYSVDNGDFRDGLFTAPKTCGQDMHVKVRAAEVPSRQNRRWSKLNELECTIKGDWSTLSGVTVTDRPPWLLIDDKKTSITATCGYARHTADFRIELEENVGYVALNGDIHEEGGKTIWGAKGGTNFTIKSYASQARGPRRSWDFAKLVREGKDWPATLSTFGRYEGILPHGEEVRIQLPRHKYFWGSRNRRTSHNWVPEGKLINIETSSVIKACPACHEASDCRNERRSIDFTTDAYNHVRMVTNTLNDRPRFWGPDLPQKVNGQPQTGVVWPCNTRDRFLFEVDVWESKPSDWPEPWQVTNKDWVDVDQRPAQVIQCSVRGWSQDDLVIRLTAKAPFWEFANKLSNDMSGVFIECGLKPLGECWANCP